MHPRFILGRFMCFPVSKKISGKFQSYKFQSCYGLNMQQMQILQRVTLDIVEFDSLAPSYPFISLFFEK